MADLRVKNWQRFQHYRDRNPPWIKLHYELLSSRDWVMLADTSKALAIACMLVASRNDGLVPNDPDYMQRVAYLHTRPDFRPLISCGFLVDESALAHASKPERLQADARPETETETETEREARAVRAPANGRSKGTTLAPDWKPSEPDITYAASRGLFGHQLGDEVERFRNYWTAKSGRDACKRDWHATWRNWVLNSKGRKKPTGSMDGII